MLPQGDIAVLLPSSAALDGLQGCCMERTKLSTRQIKHALPTWMCSEVIEISQNDRRTTKKTRRGSRARKNKENNSNSANINNNTNSITINNNNSNNNSNNRSNGNRSSPSSPKDGWETSSLSKRIASLPADLQKCFTEWRRERKQAILTKDTHKQGEVERVMWQALSNLGTRRN